jgi:RHS repeat-associated protein
MIHHRLPKAFAVGNGVYIHMPYNNRQQICQLWVQKRSVGSGVVKEMRRILQYLCALSFCFLVSTTAIHAQANPNIDQGFHPYGSYEGGTVDTVSLSNGALNIQIPVVSYPQRGDLHLSFSLRYGSKAWSVAHTPTTLASWIMPTQLGPVLTIDQSASVRLAKFTYPDPNGIAGQSFIKADVIVDASGAQHLTGSLGTSSSAMALDASGYAIIDPSKLTNLTVPPGRTSASSVADRAGILYTALDNLDSMITDKNGNQIIYTFNQNWTDSAGRVIPQTPWHDTGSNSIGNATSVASCPSGSTVAYSWIVPAFSTPTGSTATYILCYANVAIATNFHVPSGTLGQTYVAEYQGAVPLLNALVLPNGQSWKFGYDSYGDITSITYPTGGTVGYTWTTNTICTSNNAAASRWVASRTVTDSTGSHTWNYDFSSGTGVVVKDPAGNDTVHQFSAFQGCTLYETGTQYWQGPSTGGGTLLKSVQTTYRHDDNPYWDNYDGVDFGALNVVPLSVTTTLSPSSTQVVTYTPDQGTSWNFYNANNAVVGQDPNTPETLIYGSMVETDVSDFGSSSSGGAILQKNLVTYQWQNDGNYLSANLLDAPAVSTTKDGSGNPVAKTTYTYDESSYLVASSGIGQHGSPWAPVRGNVSKIDRWLNTGPSDPLTHTGWYDTGEVAFAIDADGHAKSNGHTADYQYNLCNGSVLTDTTNALNQHTSATYDCNTGHQTGYTDANNNTSGFGYDIMGRIHSANYPDGGSTTFDYDDAHNTVTRTIAADPDPAQTTIVTFDGFGREIHRYVSDSPQQDIIDTTYDRNGRVYTVSNPYRSTSDSTYGLTTYAYDALGRQTIQTQPDGGLVQWCYNGISTGQASYVCLPNASSTTGAWVDYSDEENRHGQRISDALGRLTAVMEPVANIPTLETDYSYNPLNNLISVNQKGTSGETPRSRGFVYDSLSRLITATNPETGTICFGIWSSSNCINGYDANGNLINKTDARNITTTYGYDALNRLTAKQAPGINYSYMYDAPGSTFTSSNAIGRMTEASNNVNASEQYSYDAMGRVIWQENTVPDVCCSPPQPTISAAYDLAGNMTSLTYPDGRVVKQNWNAAGHLQSATFDNWNGQNIGYPYLSSATYWPNGSPQTMTFGKGDVETRKLNNRLQPVEISVQGGANLSNQTYYDKQYCYGPVTPTCPSFGTVGNNGNIWQIYDSLNSNRSQAFSYDSLNRLTGFSNGDSTMRQTYLIDSFGNMSTVSGGVATTTFNAATNRISNLPCAASVTPFDAAGNQLCDTDTNGAVRQYGVDADNHITQIAILGNTSSPFETYTYDANGSRVRKTSANGTYTEYVYFNGQPLAEKNSDGTWSDYIYANGQKIARADSYDVRIHFAGTNCSNCGPTAWAYNIPVPAYTIQSGDKIAWRQYQDGPAVPRGGLGLRFSDGTYTNWVTVDQDGQVMNDDTTQNAWHYRVADLSQYAGKTIAAAWINEDTGSGAGNWEEWFSDIAFFRTDGTVQPIYDRQTNVSYPSFGFGGVTNLTFEVNISNQPGDAEQPLNTTTYYIGDQIGSTRLEFAGGGWPVSSSTFYPFGQEQSATADPNHYKFTGKERDSESGLDYFGARYYGSSMGRMMSPDPHSGTIIHQLNPQRWNMYAYALNNPLSFTDPTGMDAVAVNFSGMVGGLGHEGILSIHSDGSTTYGRFGPAKQDLKGGYGLNEPGRVDVKGPADMPKLEFGSNGLPTSASYAALEKAVAAAEGVDPSTVRLNYFKTSESETAALDAYIKQKQANPGRYGVCDRNCATFTMGGLMSASVLQRWQTSFISIDPNEMFKDLSGLADDNKRGNEKVTVTIRTTDGQVLR